MENISGLFESVVRTQPLEKHTRIKYYFFTVNRKFVTLGNYLTALENYSKSNCKQKGFSNKKFANKIFSLNIFEIYQFVLHTCIPLDPANRYIQISIC